VTVASIAEEIHDEEVHEPHLEQRNYWLIALFLGIVTALEVAITYIDALAGPLLVIGLIVLGIVKFATVVGWFMHLRYEPFTMNFMFIFGLLGAITLFIVVLLSFRALFHPF
jgi:heme/copper-type cytochrome/quinol oxidase subunit 4